MNKFAIFLAMVPLCCFAAGSERVVIKEKASQLQRVPSITTNVIGHAPDWQMDYIIPAKDAKRLKGLKLQVRILEKGGRVSKKYTSYISEELGTLRVTVHPREANRVWKSHELGDVVSIIVVGERARPRLQYGDAEPSRSK